MYVTVRVGHEVARMLHRQQSTASGAAELKQAVKEFGLMLVPIHPSIEDEELMRYFAVEVPSQSVADSLIQRLRQCTAVDAAYVKPPDELP